VTSVLQALIVGGALAAIPVAAQVRQTAAPPSTAQIQARHEVSALEGVLENAVQYGAQMLDQHLQASNAANMVMLTGMARSRGFRLEGYGVLFDVEFPSLRRSMVWSMRALERPDPEMTAAMQELRKNLQTVTDPRARQELERALKIFEAHIKAFDAQARSQARGISAAANSANDARPTAAPALDPRAFYLSEITNALVAAVLDHGAPVGVGPEEWLTVAARESVDRRFVPDDPNDMAMTLILRIKGSDLNALRDRRLSREDARKRVEVRRY
jgi:hypothetical protein